MPIRTLLSSSFARFQRQFVTYNQINISRLALLHNFDFFQSHMPGGFVFPVLKSNAYGHGLTEITNILKARRFPYIAVDGYFEALQVRSISKQPVLVMSAIAPVNFAKIRFTRLAFVVNDRATVEALGKTGKRVKVHVELETGMGRHGVREEDLTSFLTLLKQYPRLQVEGVMSHLADSANPHSTQYIDMQAQRFDHGVEKIRAAGFAPKYLHLAQSAGSLKARSKYANAIRVGIGLYGINPLDPRDAFFPSFAPLRPVLQLTSTISRVYTIKPGEAVSYDCTYVAKKSGRIGVLPLGYYEGVPRGLSNNGYVRFEEAYAPVVGNVNMNHTMIDLTDLQAKLGDQVEVISANSATRTSVASLSKALDIIPWELLVRLSPTTRRRIVD